MEIKDMSIEQIESHLEERKRVKPRASFEMVVSIVRNCTNIGTFRRIVDLLKNLNWGVAKMETANLENVLAKHVEWNQQTELSFEEFLLDLDWTPPKQDYEMELVEGMPCLIEFDGKYKVASYVEQMITPKTTIPFDRSLVGKAVE